MNVIIPENRRKKSSFPFLLLVVFAFIAIPSLMVDKRSSSPKEQPRLPVSEAIRPVNDNAGILSSGFESSLSDYLLSLDREKGIQIAVITVKTIGDKSIEEFSMECAERMRLGKSGMDNGALLVVSTETRDVRIETGYGTECALTDAICSQIIRNVIVPAFRRGDYEEGIAAAVKKMAQVISSDETLVKEGEVHVSGSGEEMSRSESVSPVLVILFILFVLFFGGRRHGGFFLFPWFFSPFGGYRHHGSFGGSSGFHSSSGGGFSSGGGNFGGGGASGKW